jgi:hypothetical protein
MKITYPLIIRFINMMLVNLKNLILIMYLINQIKPQGKEAEPIGIEEDS